MSSSSETTNSRKKANKTGSRLEVFIEQALQGVGYREFWNHKKQAFQNRAAIGGKVYCKQLPVGSTTYETDRKCDFFIVNRKKFSKDLIIECKWQQSSGSVDDSAFAFQHHQNWRPNNHPD